MASHTIKGVIAFSCDECPETYEPHDQSDFAAAWAEARARGWRSFRHGGGEHEHQCPMCATEQED